MKILNFGSCNIDYVYTLDHIVCPGETETCDSIELFAGGKGLNQSIAAARAGAEVYHAGCIGYDGEELRTLLLENNVDVSFIEKIDEKNGHAIIQLGKNGENSIFLYPGANECITDEQVDSVTEHFSEGDILILQNEVNNIDYIVKKAYKRGMRIIFNPAPFNDKINTIDFNMLSYVVVNEVELKGLSGCTDCEEGLCVLNKKYPSVKVVLTLGSKGCVYTDGTQKLYQSAFDVEATDTTAAGDTFIGYFAAGLVRGEKYKQILKTASAASALAVSKKGAAPSVPKIEEVRKALEYLKEKSEYTGEEVLLKKKAELYIERNLKTATLNGLAKTLGYSPAYAGRLFKKLTGKTFSAAVQEIRCDRVAKKLKETNLPIYEIISETGYENENFLRKKFAERYGKNLSEFRKESK